VRITLEALLVRFFGSFLAVGAVIERERFVTHISQGKGRTKDELAVNTARLKTAVCLDYLLKRDPFGNTRPDGVSCQQTEEVLQVLPKPLRMSLPH
jgi:hypothetical protein